MEQKSLQIVESDPWLKPYEAAIVGRYQHVESLKKELTSHSGGSLSKFASGYLYFGLHKTKEGWVFREWAPNATQIYLIGDFNHWQELPNYRLSRKAGGVWSITLPLRSLRHGDFYKMKVYWEGGCG